MNREPFVQVALGAALVAGDYWHLPFGMVIGALLVIVGGRTWFTTRRAAKEAQKGHRGSARRGAEADRGAGGEAPVRRGRGIANAYINAESARALNDKANTEDSEEAEAPLPSTHLRARERHILLGLQSGLLRRLQSGVGDAEHVAVEAQLHGRHELADQHLSRPQRAPGVGRRGWDVDRAFGRNRPSHRWPRRIRRHLRPHARHGRKPPPMSLYVVTATLNGLDHTQFLYEAITKVDPSVPVARFVVVDNGSSDGTLEWFGARMKDGVQIIANDSNLGAATAWNQGISFAIKNGASAILVAGNDTCPHPGTVERLYGLIQDGCLFVTGTAVPYQQTGGPVPPCPADCQLLAAPDFSFMMLTPRAIEAVGQWDFAHELSRRQWAAAQNPPARIDSFSSPWTWGLFEERMACGFFEDNQYVIRGKMAGVQMLRDPGAYFRHDTSLTIRINPEVEKLNREQTFRQNAELFRAQWGGLPHEVDAVTARPLNVSDAQWAQMSGGRPVVEIDKAAAVEQAKRVYAQYGVA